MGHIPYLWLYHKHKSSHYITKCVFVGYNLCQKDHKSIDYTGRLYIVISLKFNETKFPFFHNPQFKSSFSPSDTNSSTSKSFVSINTRSWQLPLSSIQLVSLKLVLSSTSLNTKYPLLLPTMSNPNISNGQCETSITSSYTPLFFMLTSHCSALNSLKLVHTDITSLMVDVKCNIKIILILNLRTCCQFHLLKISTLCSLELKQECWNLLTLLNFQNLLSIPLLRYPILSPLFHLNLWLSLKPCLVLNVKLLWKLS